MTIDTALQEVGFAQRQRLAYIDFCLLFRGHLSRNDVIERFEVGLSAGTRDFGLYRQLAPENITYDTRRKRYYQSQTFRPLFEHHPQHTLIKLAHAISDGTDAIGDIQFPVIAPAQLNVPDIFIVAHITQAILNRHPVSMIYTSLSSGSHGREFIPHAIVDNGLRWHVRGYDCKTESFRDFVLTRISQVNKVSRAVLEHETQASDHQWNRTLVLQLSPHPHNVEFPTAIELDYAMQDGVLNIETRAALAGYLLRRWNVDCSEHAELRGAEFQLHLRNRQTLMGAENLAIAPGYSD
jgi:predicted DNA-binding transcriptional regulator YafY